MLTRRILPLLALAGIVYSIISTAIGAKTPEPAKPVIAPHPRPARERLLAGSGLVEARRENIPIGVSVPGVVVEVLVKRADHVKAGDPLFRVDDREARGQVGVKEAQLESAQAQLRRREAAPRPEDIPPLEAAVEEAQGKLNDAEASLARTERLVGRGAAASSDLDKGRFTYQSARGALARARAELARTKKGTWQEDINVARASVKLAQSELTNSRIQLDRLTVRAPIEGDVLQLNVRPGQFAAMTWNEPMIVLGDINRLHVRVDIDENDVPLFDQGAAAMAYFKGRSQGRFPLKFEYVEPYMVPKQSLTGSSSERVDTRVLRVVYSLPEGCQDDVHVGQQMDVYIKVPAERWDAAFDSVGRPSDPFATGSAATPAVARSPGPPVGSGRASRTSSAGESPR
jgi:multidrug resistance efflux pump